MRRDRLRPRKFLRELAWYGAAVGFVLVFFDWLIWPLAWPHAPVAARLAGDAGGLALFWGSLQIGRYNRRLGRTPPPAEPPEA